MKKVFLMLLFLSVLTTGMLLAQDAEPGGIDPAIVQIIITTGIGGMGVAALTELVKRVLLKLLTKVNEKIVAYASCLITSAAATGVYFIAAGGFNLLGFAGYTAAVFLWATGLYKMQPKPPEPPA